MTALMDADNVARRYAFRPGCRFVGFQEVGIAVFLMDLRVVVMEAREVPPVDEFLLRALGLSVDSPEELASFLGLDARTVHNRMVELRRAELIDVESAGHGEGVRCQLTFKGKAATETLYRSALTEITLPGIVFHGFLRRPVLIGEDALLRPRDLRDREMIAIPPLPSRHPHPEEIDLSSLTEVVKRQWKHKRKGTPPELISVRSILRNVKTLYQPAVLLQYDLLEHKKQRVQDTLCKGEPVCGRLGE